MIKFSLLMLLLAPTPRAYSCSEDHVDPDGPNLFYYDECLHMERKFNDEIHEKCKLYSEQMRSKYN